MVYTYWKSNWFRYTIARPWLFSHFVAFGVFTMVWWKYTINKLGDEKNFYIFAHPKWAPRKFHAVYNWKRDPIKGTLSEVWADQIRSQNCDIEQPLKITLPSNKV
eukprot:RCo021071